MIPGGCWNGAVVWKKKNNSPDLARRTRLDSRGGFVGDLKKIALNYLKTWFLIDMAACLPVDYISRAFEGRLYCSYTLEGE